MFNDKTTSINDDMISEVMNTAAILSIPKLLPHQQIEHWAQTRPDSVALKYRDQSLTYQELNQRANQLAHHLQSKNIGKDSLVVVCLEPGLEILIALLGIFKAGAIYVPLDPTYPVNRIQAILEDTNPEMLISRGYLLKKLDLNRFPSLALDTDEALLSGLSTENPATLIDPMQSASVFYTSGTTGKPKGVLASYSNVESYIRVARERYQVTHEDRMPAIARFGFSISLFELLLPLVSGGRLTILDRDHVLDLPRLTQTISEMTFFHAGPSLLKSLLAHIKQKHPNSDLFSKVRHASSGGDMIPPEVLEDLKTIFANAEVFVIYGCSEISCMGCTWPVPREERIKKTFVGLPFERMKVAVLNSELQTVPEGEVGEVFFSGDGVVKGYLNRPDLMTQKFKMIDGHRYYSTGDVGRKNPEGMVELLGRVDFQIKIRGMRIEPAEVEYHLRQAPGVRDGLVSAKNAANGEKTLVAYVVYESGVKNPTPIRHYLADHLPDYMVPSHYQELKALPLNHNMKVDRNALPDLDFANLRQKAKLDFREPQSMNEIRIASIWKKLLKCQGVGLDDNFFDLGGHSLLAVEFIVEMESVSGVRLEGMDVLRETLSLLASVCDRSLGFHHRRHLGQGVSLTLKDTVETFHFGRENDLFGVLHRPEVMLSEAPEAVLICAPVGQEFVRSHFVLNNLSRLLSAQGVPVLRFDYYGCGDSFGDHEETSFARWREDVIAAYDELKKRTHAAKVVGIGMRLGATLLCNAIDQIDLSQVILCDPVIDGAKYLEEMQEMHRKHILNERGLKPVRTTKGLQETVMELSLNEESIRELKALSISPAISAHTIYLNFNWNDVGQMNTIFPDVGIIRSIATMLGERVCLK